MIFNIKELEQKFDKNLIMPRDYNYNMYQALSSVSDVSFTIEKIIVVWNMNCG